MATLTLHLEPTGLSGTYLTHLASEYELNADASVFTGWHNATRFTLVVKHDGSALGLVDSNPSDTMFRAAMPGIEGTANIEEVFMEPGSFDSMSDELHVPITSSL
tara:strand:+ start:2756 stop:3070 length:315 start_codon:yes stop_codon:yes gene_type:complete